ncbi:MAG: hypothetical protein L3J02_06905, partial [Henriciella sp.]|nr:hypothetical protein [Henriciella sp.]
MAGWVKRYACHQPREVPACAGNTVPRGECWRAGRPWFWRIRIIPDVQDVDFAVAGHPAEHHAAGLFDPAFDLKKLPPDPWPEIDRDVPI